jgi:DNA ligase D-like protein (predicted ligase)
MDKLFDLLSAAQKDCLQQTSQPDWVAPMLATLTDRRFSAEDWIYERKLDGERCLAFRQGGEVTLLSRNQKSLNTQYPELVPALAAQEQGHFIVDGEVVAFDGPVTSFAKLQDRMHLQDADEARQTGVKVFYYIFDLLYLDGYDVSRVPLRARKKLLKAALDFQDPLRYVPHRNRDGEAYFQQACHKGWEGIIAKDANAPYVHSRSRKWLKFKCVRQQEFVIGGYTEPHGERIEFGALLLGYYRDGKLKYAGKVGTGFDDKTLKRLGNRLAKLEQDKPAFDDGDLPTQGVHWAAPELVAEIGFEEWTTAGKLRQPRYLGQRQDKDPQEVKRERPEA